MSDTVISVRNLSKAYRIWKSPSHRLTSRVSEEVARIMPGPLAHALRGKAAQGYRDFYALRDVSFEVRRGEAVGIIGRNGSGKSTLLQIIAGTLQPSSGEVQTHGRVAALLELGSGFNPEFTGRENVFLNGSVLGLSRTEMTARYAAICGFADIGEFIDQPVKTYSTGMLMRLAFAVQASVDPDVLVIDEALAVGDAPFQAKCFARLRALAKRNVAILLVTHDISAVRTLCQRAVCLVQGAVFAAGAPKDVCDAYELYCMKESGLIPISQGPVPSPGAAPDVWGLNALPIASHVFAQRAALQRTGSGKLRLVDCILVDRNGRPRDVIEFNEEVYVQWLVRANVDFEGVLVLALTVKTLKGSDVLSGTDKSADHLVCLRKAQHAAVRMLYRFPLKGQKYYLTSSLFRFPNGRKFEYGTINFAAAELLDLVEYSFYFEVNWDRRWCHYGPVQINSTQDWRIFDETA